MNTIAYANRSIEKLHRQIHSSISRGFIEDALFLIERCAALQYDLSISFTDDYLEQIIKDKRISDLCASDVKETVKGNVLFYDGFGLGFRGLALIYIRALVKRYHVVYVVSEVQIDSAQNIIDEVINNGGEVLFLHKNTRIGKIKELSNYLLNVSAENVFIYTKPNDVVAVSTFTNSVGSWNRYQINLTDHRFWLGRGMFDTCIEFRDFGAWVSVNKRNIDSNKIVKLPYYPIINTNTCFLGFPDGMITDGKQIVFSGGHLSKTNSKDKKFYRIISYILDNHEEALFWYAGSGDKTDIVNLQKKYPQRVFYTQERKDLFQLMKKCFIYISTYPISGGLMFQYAAKAGIPPLTLKLDDSGLGILINEDKLNIIFDSFDELTNRIDELFNYGISDEYKALLVSSVQEECSFCDNLFLLLDCRKTTFDIDYSVPNMDEMIKSFSDSIKICQIDSFFVFKERKLLMFRFPLKSLRGAFYFIKKRINRS